MDEMTLILNSPITEEQWDMIEDVDFDHTDIITFYTKHGKEVEFVKRKTGKWIDYAEDGYVECPFCHSATNCDGNIEELHFCFSCGAMMEGEQP